MLFYLVPGGFSLHKRLKRKAFSQKATQKNSKLISYTYLVWLEVQFLIAIHFQAYGKRSAGQKMMRNPNGFNFPMGKRYLINPNGFNFPNMPKRSAPELDLDGNFFGQRGKR